MGNLVFKEQAHKGRPRGRPKGAQKTINEYLIANQRHIPQLLEELLSQALTLQTIKCPKCHEYIEIKGGGNTEALKYLLDRHFGKAPQSIAVTAKTIPYTGDELSVIAEEVKAKELAMLTQIELVGTDEDINEPAVADN